MFIEGFLGHVIVKMMKRVKENCGGCLEIEQGGGEACSRQREEQLYCSGARKSNGTTLRF